MKTGLTHGPRSRAALDTILSRAVDDSVNLETLAPGRTVTVDSLPTRSLFSSSDTPAVASDSDAQFVNVGVKFSSSQSGTILGIKFYKGLGDGGTHVGAIWSSTGTLLASATFVNETTSGWQTVIFSNPISVSAGTTYVASYSSSGHYASSDNSLRHGKDQRPADRTSRQWLLYLRNGHPFSRRTRRGGTNYWVDVIFSPTETVNQLPVGNNDDGYIVTQGTPFTFSAATLLANDTDPNGDILTITGVGGAVGGTVRLQRADQRHHIHPHGGLHGGGDPSVTRYPTIVEAPARRSCI